jgi:hypothetical protein
VTPSSDNEVPSDVTAHCAQEGIKGGNKQRMQRPQGTTTMTSCDDGHDWKAGGSDVGCILTTTCSDKRPMRPPTDHFKRLCDEACPNHAYPVRHKLKDYGMMRSIMTSWSLTWGTELDKGPDRSDTTSFPEENIIMMEYGDAPPPLGEVPYVWPRP